MRMNLLKTLGMIILAVLLIPFPEAHALPSFARQTGMDCSICHTVFPELTSFGHVFKLRGYTLTNVTQGQTAGLRENYYPPLAAMMLVSFTSLEKKQPDSQNGNALFPDQFSLFYAGRISDSAGAFAQITYNGVDDHFSMDNADIRFVGDTTLAGDDLLYGLTLNNNPTVQDVWNSTPAWGFPFIASPIAPSPTASSQIDGALAQQVAGLGVYGYWNSKIYGELTLYRSSQIGANEPPTSTSKNVIDGTAPYWRLAVEQNWGKHSLEIGTYGLVVNMFPGDGSPLSGPTNRFTDIAFDAQYHFINDPHIIAFHTTWIQEKQDWNASFPSGSTSSASDRLTTFKIDGSYYYKRSIGGSLGFFTMSGNSDPLLYAGEPVTGSANGSPDSVGEIAEIDYLPWLNMKFAVQYVRYDKFNGARSNYDGSDRKASDNNTLYVYAWLMF
jgi:hypothetical protein